MMLFVLLNIAGVLLGLMVTLFVMLFDDPRRVAGRKRGKR